MSRLQAGKATCLNHLRAAFGKLAGVRGTGAATPGTTVLLVAVPEARRLYERWDGDRRRLGVPGLPLHATVLYPFMPAAQIDSTIEHDLEALAASQRRFDYVLDRLGRFPGVLYAAPSPSRPFVALTQAVHARWPLHPPYGGTYPEIVPHVTLLLGKEPAGLAAAVRSALPVRGIARELLLLMIGEDKRWVELKRFALGGW